MENSSLLEDPLERLTEAEKQVYDEICKAWNEDESYITITEIGNILNIGEDESRRRLTKIYEKLEITGTDHDKRVRLIINYCLKSKLAPEIPVEVPPQDIEEPPETPPQSATTEIEIEPTGGRINSRAVVQRLGLILAALVTIGIIGFLAFRGNRPAAGLPDRPVPSDSPALASGETQLPSLAHPSPTTFETAAATPPVELAQVLTDTASPTETLAPTGTLAPTITPTTPPTLIPLGFEDVFSDGLSEEWEVLSGEPLILDQAFLTPSGNDLFIAYGDPGWTDYEVEIGIEAAICGTEHGNFIALRMAGNHFIALAFSGCGGSFWEFEGNNWRQIPGSAYDNPGLRGETVRAVVRQNEVVAYVRGLQVKSITTRFPEGRVGLKMIRGSKITFFRVRELQP